MVASIEGDTAEHSARETIRDSLKTHLGDKLEIVVLPETLRLTDGHDQDAEAKARTQARKWLKEKRCDLIIWGRIKAPNILALRVTAADLFESSLTTYSLSPTTLDLPVNFISDLGAAIALRVASALPSIDIPTEDITQRLRTLATKPHRAFDPLTQMLLLHVYGYAEATIGIHNGSKRSLLNAVSAFKFALRKQRKSPDKYFQAKITNDLGWAYMNLGERDSNAETLKKAISAFEDAANNFKKLVAKEDLGWALMQLGTSLRILGERNGLPQLVEKAVSTFREALSVFRKSNFPDCHAFVQNNLGNALRSLGARSLKTEYLTQAIDAHSCALLEINRIDKPTEWGLLQNNLGLDLLDLGSRASDVKILQRSLDAFEKAFSSQQDMTVPQKITIRNNLAIVNTEIGRLLGETKYLLAAVKILTELVKGDELTLTPYEKGQALHHLGSAQLEWGIMESNTDLMKQAKDSYLEALQQRSKKDAPYDWAGTMDNIGGAIIVLAELTKDFSQINEAIERCQAALSTFESIGATYDAKTARSRLNTALELKQNENQLASAAR
jgi:tetratricopeptide (TPR) repeat protein